MLTKNLKFSESAKQTALRAYDRGVEGATVRYEDEKDISERDVLALCEPSGRRFGHADVTATESSTVESALGCIWDRRDSGVEVVYGHDAPIAVFSALRRHYGSEIQPDTNVKVVFYNPTLVMKSAKRE